MIFVVGFPIEFFSSNRYQNCKLGEKSIPPTTNASQCQWYVCTSKIDILSTQLYRIQFSYYTTIFFTHKKHFRLLGLQPSSDWEVVNLMMVADLATENVNYEWKMWLCNKKIVFYTFKPTWWTYSITQLYFTFNVMVCIVE